MDATAFPLGLIVEPGTDDLNVGCKLCIATCIAPIYIAPLPLGLATMTLCVILGVLVKLQAASSPLAPRLRSQADTESQKQQLQRAGHEPVCLVPGSVDKYLHVPGCTLQQSLDTHSEGSLLC